ncbi:MAG: hypothetical protein R3208_09885 [Ketobacteraceae bacterium]|nr:hypothetical protein [Ketobacteraceae bacterium]
MMGQQLVPAEFAVPETLFSADFILRPLTIHHLVKDYDAVMSSAERLRGVLGPQTDWPPEDLTLEQDLVDLGWHQREFQMRRSFAYTVLSPDESRCLGCLYIYPSENSSYDAMVVMWVRDGEFRNNLDEALFSTVKQWLRDHWPFSCVAFPGRDTPWSDCNSF